MEFLLNSRNILYVIAAVLFIFGIKGMTHPRTAVRGNMLGFAGMMMAMAHSALPHPLRSSLRMMSAKIEMTSQIHKKNRKNQKIDQST